MGLTEKIAKYIGMKVKESLEINKEEEEIIVYGAFNIIQIINTLIFVILSGIIFKCLIENIIISLTSAVLRKYSGGVHASSPLRCIIIGTSFATGLGCITNNFSYIFDTSFLLVFILTCSFLSINILYRLAPVDSAEKPISSLKQKKKFKNQSISIAVIYFVSSIILLLFNITDLRYEIVICIMLGMIWQCWTLTKFGFKVIKTIDYILKIIMEKEVIRNE